MSKKTKELPDHMKADYCHDCHEFGARRVNNEILIKGKAKRLDKLQLEVINTIYQEDSLLLAGNKIFNKEETGAAFYGSSYFYAKAIRISDNELKIFGYSIWTCVEDFMAFVSDKYKVQVQGEWKEESYSDENDHLLHAGKYSYDKGVFIDNMSCSFLKMKDHEWKHVDVYGVLPF